MNITIYEVFELNRILHRLIEQQKSYEIRTAFKLYKIVKWLDGTENFVLERMKMVFGDDKIDTDNSAHMAFLGSQIPFMETSLTLDELMGTMGAVNIEVSDFEILEKIFPKTEG